MAATGNPSHKQMKRMESKKSHSWWWDSHISPKNSKWLAENLEEMDRSVKRMLKLIEEDGDSFAKKAEMYYQKRPELIAHVEEFYRIYRSLAERYDHVTGELRKSVPSDLQSLGSGMSDVGSEPPSTWPSPRKLGRRISSNRAAGFDFFLGSGGNGPDVGQKEGDESSTLTDSDEESDDSSVNNYQGLSVNGSENGLNRRIMELEIELREVKDKLNMQEEENIEGSFKGGRNENSEDSGAKNNGYEKELRIVNEKLRISEEEIIRLNIELQRFKSLELTNVQAGSESLPTEQEMIKGEDALDLKAPELQGSIDELELEFSEPDGKIKSLVEELRIYKRKLEASEQQIHSMNYEASKSSDRIQQLQDQLDLARKELGSWKTKFNSEKRESAKLQERLAMLKTSLSDRDHEIRDLKTAVCDAEQKIFPEKAQLKAEISQMLEEQTYLKEQIREWESHGRSFEEEIRNINSEKSDMEEMLKGEIELLKADIMERESNIKYLHASLDAFELERDNLNSEINSLKGKVSTRDDRIQCMDKHLNQLHMEQVKLLSGMEEAHRQVEELKSRTKRLEEEVERQKTEILEGAEEKREAIRQLCFSLEHYRNGYQTLRQAVKGHKHQPILAA